MSAIHENTTSALQKNLIALGTIVVIGVYHLARLIAPRQMKAEADGATLIYDAPGIYTEDDEPRTNA